MSTPEFKSLRETALAAEDAHATAATADIVATNANRAYFDALETAQAEFNNMDINDDVREQAIQNALDTPGTGDDQLFYWRMCTTSARALVFPTGEN